MSSFHLFSWNLFPTCGLSRPRTALNPFGILSNTRLLSQLLNIPNDGSRFKRTEQLLGYLSQRNAVDSPVKHTCVVLQILCAFDTDVAP